MTTINTNPYLATTDDSEKPAINSVPYLVKLTGGAGGISGEGEPSFDTAGQLGQLYINTTTNDAYVCVKNEEGSSYWRKVTLGAMPVQSFWATFKRDVRSGVAQTNYPVGTILYTDMSYLGDEYNISEPYQQGWRIVDYQTVTKEDNTQTMAAILQTVEGICACQAVFDAAEEETVATEETAQEGYYYYSVSGSTKNYLDVEVGEPLPYSDYDSILKSDTFAFKNNPGWTNGGCPIWAYSNARAYLNADGAYNTWWEPQHMGDKLGIDYAGDGTHAYTNKHGFMRRLPADFVDAILPIKNRTYTWDKDSDDYIDTVDKVWLPSAEQMYCDITGDSYKQYHHAGEGTAFAYFKQAIDTEKGTTVPTSVNCIARKFYRIEDTEHTGWTISLTTRSVVRTDKNGGSSPNIFNINLQGGGRWNSKPNDYELEMVPCVAIG